MLHLQHIAHIKTAAVHSRIEPRLKKKAETILHRLGVSPTDAIRMFYTQITLRNGLPFPVEIPHATTRQTLEDSRDEHCLTTHRNA